jgi:hypothetical protein
VADAVDAAVNQVEAAGREAMLDRSAAKPELNELPPRDDTVLT